MYTHPIVDAIGRICSSRRRAFYLCFHSPAESEEKMIGVFADLFRQNGAAISSPNQTTLLRQSKGRVKQPKMGE
jgi:hypothetical protein